MKYDIQSDFFKEAFYKQLGSIGKSALNIGKRVQSVGTKSVINPIKQISSSTSKMNAKVRGNIAVAKSEMKSGFTGKKNVLTQDQIRNQANLKHRLKQNQATKIKTPAPKRNLPKDISPTKKPNIIDKGRKIWGNMSQGQKNIAKGVTGGAAVAGGAIGASRLVSGSRNNQQQGYYR